MGTTKNIKYEPPSDGDMMLKRECPGTDTHRVLLQQIRPVPNVKITCPQDVVTLLREMEDYDREYFKIIFIDTKNQILGIENIAQGSLNAAIVHPREAVKGAALISAAGVIAAHNHPSGIPEPSIEDTAVVEKLQGAFGLLGIYLIDAIIIGRETFYSFKQEGKLIKLKDLRSQGIASSSGRMIIMENQESQDEACGYAMEAAIKVISETCGGEEMDEPEEGKFWRMHLKQEVKGVHALAVKGDYEIAKFRADGVVETIDYGVSHGLISKEYGETVKQAVQKALEM